MSSGVRVTTGVLGEANKFVRLLAVFMLVLLTACASRPQETAAIRVLTPQEAIDPQQGPILETQSDVNLVKDGHSILALSAGGADGAYGAGVLNGWTASGERPEFDVVTGVSTGALLAVLAFLGPDYDQLAKQLYTTQTNSQIFRKKGLSSLFGESLLDNEPFKNQIKQYVTADLLTKIAAEHRKGRRLYIATTNIDAGTLVIWDMGKIATGDGGGRADSLQHFQKVLRASAAVPGYFEPVYIKPKRGVQLRQAHVDGGVKEPILYAEFMGRSKARKKNLYMVINGTTRRFNANHPVEPTLASISRKTISELIRELQRETIFHHYVAAQNNGVKFHLTSIPDSIPIAKEVLNFDPERMNQLYKAGFEAGQAGPGTWNKRPPTVSTTGTLTQSAQLQ